MMRRAVSLIAVMMMMAGGSAVWAADGNPIGKTTSETAVTPGGLINLNLRDVDVKTILEVVAKQSGERIIVESTVKGKLELSVSGVSAEAALSAICKMSGKTEWRKVYVDAESDLVKQPDKFASTIRLLSGLGFPNLIVAGSSKDRVTAHFDDKKSVATVEESTAKKLGMVKVYLVTNDSAIAAKAAAEEKKDAVGKYSKMQQDMMDAFMKMTPEEREQAILESLNMVDKVGPEYMGAAMEALSKADPEALRQRTAKQMDMLLSMSPESRRAMMRMSMQSQQMISPEVRRILEEDAKAIMEEMQAQQGAQQ